ncbi:MAG: hypothetical protein LBB52_03980 [Desulfovibrio sp.]|jgi:hypothetical protein|nr:hypothetical protein [Desulfovibrio sp.]
MSIETTTTKQIYEGNGSAVVFPVPFLYNKPEHIKLLYTDAQETDREISGNFQVVVNGAGDTSVTYPVTGEPIPSGTRLTLYRQTPQTQIIDFTSVGDFDPDVLEHDGLDRLEMQIQELQEEIYRAIKSSLSDTDPPPLIDAFYRQLQELFAGLKSRLEAIREQAEDYADKAEAAAAETYMESGAFNVRRCFVAEEDIEAGGTLVLPVPYYPGRAVLRLDYQGMACTPKDADVDNTGLYQYAETGDDPNVLSSAVVVHFPVRAGDKFDLWIVASALGRNLVTYLDGHDFGDPAADAHWQQTLTDYALARVTNWDTVPNSCGVVNLWNGHEWIYNTETGLWIDFGASAVATATNETAGIVKGNATVTGKISIDAGGEMAVNTTPPQTTKLTSALSANSTLAVPAHVVGSGVLKVYLNGLLCEAGTAAANGFYQEVDATTIKIFDALPVGARITAVLTA